MNRDMSYAEARKRVGRDSRASNKLIASIGKTRNQAILSIPQKIDELAKAVSHARNRIETSKKPAEIIRKIEIIRKSCTNLSLPDTTGIYTMQAKKLIDLWNKVCELYHMRYPQNQLAVYSVDDQRKRYEKLKTMLKQKQTEMRGDIAAAKNRMKLLADELAERFIEKTEMRIKKIQEMSCDESDRAAFLANKYIDHCKQMIDNNMCTYECENMIRTEGICHTYKCSCSWKRCISASQISKIMELIANIRSMSLANTRSVRPGYISAEFDEAFCRLRDDAMSKFRTREAENMDLLRIMKERIKCATDEFVQSSARSISYLHESRLHERFAVKTLEQEMATVFAVMTMDQAMTAVVDGIKEGLESSKLDDCASHLYELLPFYPEPV